MQHDPFIIGYTEAQTGSVEGWRNAQYRIQDTTGKLLADVTGNGKTWTAYVYHGGGKHDAEYENAAFALSAVFAELAVTYQAAS